MREGLQKIVSSEETIVAISSPLGRSAIGVVRMSGREALAITRRFFKSSFPMQHRNATFGTWLDPGGEALDEVVVTYFVAPQSYTGEDVVEISAHGNPLIHQSIIECLCDAGARLATPGEFTLRAVAHGKMDLIQAEAVREFIEAQTTQQARIALRQLDGAGANRLRPIKNQILDIVARLEAGIDFAEDDIDVPEGTSIAEKLQPLVTELREIQATFGYGRMLIRGLSLAIVGKPNVGKSSLFNRIIAIDRAIVTDIPGTTRDVVSETIHLEGVPIRFSDTAGIRTASDVIEKMGVSRTIETLAEADLTLVVLDGSSDLDIDDETVLARTADLPRILVVNKCDLTEVVSGALFDGSRVLRVSARTGAGLEALRDAIRCFLLDRRTDLADDFILTSGRQNEAILKSIAALGAGAQSIRNGVPHEMVLLDLYEALSALDEMTGEVVNEDILDRIFSTFCVGK